MSVEEDPVPPRVMRQDVRAEGGYAYGAVGADIHVFGDGTPLYLLFEHRQAAEPDPVWMRSQPSRMLDARAEVVRLTGREAELDELVSWLSSGTRFAARWLHGDGGQGKTRLANELAAASMRAGWRVVDAVHRTDAHPPAPDSQDLRLDGKQGVLLLVDYADRWPLSDLSWLFQNRLLRQRVPARVLLIGRSTSGWPALRGKLNQTRENIDTSDQYLPPLPDDRDVRGRLFDAARTSFAALYEQIEEPETIDPPVMLGHSDFGLTLAVLMAALVAVDAAASGRRPPGDMIGLTIYLLDREHENWRQLYENAEGGLNFRTNDRTMARTVFIATLAGPADIGAAHVLLKRFIPGVSHAQTLADHSVCYPPTDADRGNRLEPLLPDRLAEDFLALTVPGHPVTGYPSDTWATAFPAALLTSSETAACAPRAVTFLASAADRWTHLGENVLYPLLLARPDIAIAAGSGALTTIAKITAIDASVLASVESAMERQFGDQMFVGDETPVDLAVGFAEITARHTDVAAPGASAAERAGLHLKATRRLSVAGKNLEAAKSSSLAVEYYLSSAHDALAGSTNQVSGDDVAALSEAVNNHAVILASASQWREAGQFSLYAIDLFRELVASNAAVYLPSLAQSLGNRALLLKGSLTRAEERHGRTDDATRQAWMDQVLNHADEALACYRELVRSDPESHRHRLATAQSNRAGFLEEAGRWTEALQALDSALNLWGQVAESAPAYRLALARDLTRYGECLAQVQIHEPSVTDLVDAPSAQEWTQARREGEARVVAVFRRAVELFSELSEANPNYLPDLAAALNRVSFHLTEVGCGTPFAPVWEPGIAARPVWGARMRQECEEEVLEFSARAARIFGELAQANATVYLEQLALALNGFAWIRATLNRDLDQAWTAASTAVQIFEDLYYQEPSTVANTAYSVLFQVEALRTP